MASSISLPHSRQIEDGYCLPACAQMALAHLGVSRSQENIARTLKLLRGFGVPAPNIVNLTSHGINVIYHTDGRLDDVRAWLRRDIPVIACVQAGELPHWQGISAQHAVLVVGMDDQEVHLHDPALAHGPIAVSSGDFWLAWDEMNCRYAIIKKRG